MDATTIRNSIKLKHRFVKDNDLPIDVLVEPYFTQRTETLDDYFGTLGKFDTFINELEPFETETDYFNYVVDVAHNILFDLVGNPKFIEQGRTYGRRCECLVENRPSPCLYNENNNDKAFISIRINDFPFDILRHYSSDIFHDAKTWSDYVKQFTPLEHLAASKRLKRRIFSAPGRKARTKYAMYLLHSLLAHLENTLSVQLYSLKYNEILLSVPDGGGAGYSLSELRNAVANCPAGIGDMVTVRMFDLQYMADDWTWCRNVYQFDPNAEDSIRDYEFSHIDHSFHQIAKLYKGEPVTENDLVFQTQFHGSLGRGVYILDPWKAS